MITHITVEDAAKLISRIAGANETQALTYIREAADRGEIQATDTIEKLQADVEQAKRERDAAIKDIDSILGDEYDLDRLSVLCNQRMTMREEVSQRFSLTAKIPLDRLRELAEADREGRCVVLPCKVEDDVYINIFGRTLPFTVISISQMASTPTFKAQHGIRLVYIFKADDVGETVFMTREEAEAALAKIATDCD